MADPDEINPTIYSTDSEPSGPRVPDDKVYRLTRRLPEAKAIEDVSSAHEAQSIDLGKA